MKWFTGCNDITEIKKRYRELAMQYHPDRGGDTRIMQEINDAYEISLRGQHQQAYKGTDGETRTYYYNQDNEQAIMGKIDELLKAKMVGVDIFLIGTWLWVMGNTRQYKDILGRQGLGMRWQKHRQAWSWTPSKWHGGNSRGDFLHLATKYGAEKIYSKDEAKGVLS